MRSTFLKNALLTGASLATLLGWQSTALACGGFFCSQSAPVNQAAERIIFADNGDETVTAIIQILYEGPAESFSWLLPISTVPRGNEDIGIASNFAFTRLQNATNPSYNLTTRIEGTCAGGFSGASGSAGASAGGFPTATPGPNAGMGVTVEASGIVGAFEWTVISLGSSVDDPAEAAVLWLEENGYDVAEGARGLIGPYLEDGLYLLALRLTKGSDSGSIRPIALTYAASQPMIPIKLTAVAANEDMGVLTWLLSSARGVPQNYLSLELNEAKINWFNASSNYNDVVSAAADEAEGQGFVTEFAGASSALSEAVWSSSDQAVWLDFNSSTFQTFGELFNTSNAFWGSWDGFWDAVRSTVTLPPGVAFEDFKFCPSCYADQVQFSPSAYVTALERDVIEPVRMVQELLDSRPYVTRLYTTMSAEDMTVDPLFTFNPDLADVSNIHTAERIIECNPNISQFEAPWRIELPQGVVRGLASQVGTWPAAVDDQPSNVRISRLSSRGQGAVVEDNSAEIGTLLDEYNSSLTGSPGAGGRGTGPGDNPGSTPDGGCSLGAGAAQSAGWAMLALIGFGAIRRRRPQKEVRS